MKRFIMLVSTCSPCHYWKPERHAVHVQLALETVDVIAAVKQYVSARSTMTRV